MGRNCKESLARFLKKHLGRDKAYTEEEAQQIMTPKTPLYKITSTPTAEHLIDNGLMIVGDNCEIHESVVFPSNSHIDRIYIGQNAKVLSGAVIYPGCMLSHNVSIGHGTVLEEECLIGRDTFIGHNVVMRPRTEIGERCIIGHGTVFEGQSVIGDNVLIHAQNHITRGVRIGDNVFIAPLFVGANDPVMAHARRDLFKEEEFYQPYVIEDGVRIGVAVTLLPGVRLGKNAIIAAGAVITKDVPENAVMMGVPARQVSECKPEERL